MGTLTIEERFWAKVDKRGPDGCWVWIGGSHLEAVTSRENTQRGAAVRTHCANGYPYDDENTRRYRGTRVCRACRRDRYYANQDAERADMRARYHRRKEQAA